MKHLNEKIMNDIEHRIWTIEGALEGYLSNVEIRVFALTPMSFLVSVSF